MFFLQTFKNLFVNENLEFNIKVVEYNVVLKGN